MLTQKWPSPAEGLRRRFPTIQQLVENAMGFLRSAKLTEKNEQNATTYCPDDRCRMGLYPDVVYWYLLDIAHCGRQSADRPIVRYVRSDKRQPFNSRAWPSSTPRSCRSFYRRVQEAMLWKRESTLCTQYCRYMMPWL